METDRIKELKKEIDSIHHACWYDRGGVNGLYRCEDCEKEKILKKELESLIHHRIS